MKKNIQGNEKYVEFIKTLHDVEVMDVDGRWIIENTVTSEQMMQYLYEDGTGLQVGNILRSQFEEYIINKRNDRIESIINTRIS